MLALCLNTISSLDIGLCQLIGILRRYWLKARSLHPLGYWRTLPVGSSTHLSGFQLSHLCHHAKGHFTLLGPRHWNFTLLGSFVDLPEWHFCLCIFLQAVWPINVAYNFVKSRLVWPCCLHNFVKAVWLGNVAYFILIAAFWAWGCRLSWFW